MTRSPQVDRKHSEAGAPGGEPADAEQVACAKARALLAEQVGPKEEAIGLVAMADE